MQIVEKPAFTVTGFTIQAQWDDLWTKMPKAWQIFFQRYQEIENRINDRLIDISLHKKDDMYTQLLCVEVSREENPAPEEMITTTIPRKNYIHYKHTGSLEDIAASFGKMYDWGKKQKQNTTDFKLDIGYSSKGDDRVHDLYIECI